MPRRAWYCRVGALGRRPWIGVLRSECQVSLGFLPRRWYPDRVLTPPVTQYILDGGDKAAGLYSMAGKKTYTVSIRPAVMWYGKSDRRKSVRREELAGGVRDVEEFYAARRPDSPDDVSQLAHEERLVGDEGSTGVHTVYIPYSIAERVNMPRSF